jgi:plasmid stabilization system protein ParE
MQAKPRPALVLAPRAVHELRSVARWYDRQRPGLSVDFLQALDDTFAQVREGPTRFRAVRGEVRRALVTRFPYGVFFVEDAARVVVLAVLHSRRDPRRWPSRPAR